MHVSPLHTGTSNGKKANLWKGNVLGLAFSLLSLLPKRVSQTAPFKAFQTPSKYSVTIYCLVFIIITKKKSRL